MVMDDRDWLDRRLAAGTYVPDDGFTARVVGRLSVNRAREITRRRQILAIAAILATALILVQIIPLAHALQQLVAGQSIPGLIGAIGANMHGYLLPVSAAVAMTALALGSISLLRRWI